MGVSTEVTRAMSDDVPNPFDYRQKVTGWIFVTPNKKELFVVDAGGEGYLIDGPAHPEVLHWLENALGMPVTDIPTDEIQHSMQEAVGDE